MSSLGKRKAEDLGNFPHLGKHGKQYKVEERGLIILYYVSPPSFYGSQVMNLLCYILDKSNSRKKLSTA